MARAPYPFGVVIRKAEVDDAEAIERVRIRGWQAAYRGVFPPERLDSLEVDPTRWRAFLADPARPELTFVAAEGGSIRGFATVGPARDGDGCGEVHGLYVDPDAWSRGIGHALLAHGETTLSATWETAMLWTLADVPRTRAFYERAGWEHDGARKTFEYLGIEATVVRYCKRLRAAAP